METLKFEMEADIEGDAVMDVRLKENTADSRALSLMANLFDQESKGIWSDTRWRQYAAAGGVLVPGTEDYIVKVNPASIDLRLDGFYRRPRWYWRNPLTRWIAWQTMPRAKRDARKNEDFYWGPHRMIENLVFWPGQSMLLSTLETVHIPDDAVGVIFLKSTSARGYGFEHLHAGYVDPGWRGTLTLEAINPFAWPILIGPFTHYVQIAMFDMNEPAAEPYRGRYQDQQGATGPRPEVIHG